MDFCYIHARRISIGKCFVCDVPLCDECRALIGSEIHCRRCAKKAAANIHTQAARNPIVAAVSSFIVPGFGQVYNGQIGKGIFITITSWLVFPWLFGIYDAYKTTVKLNKGELMVKPSPGLIMEGLIIFIMILTGPMLVFYSSKFYYLFTHTVFDSYTIKRKLRTISDAAEQYAREHNVYPMKFSQLYFADPPYLDTLYCDVEVSGYVYSCVFRNDGYMITAIPEEDILIGKKTFMITTGGQLTAVAPKPINIGGFE